MQTQQSKTETRAAVALDPLVMPISNWGRQPLYQAKIGTGPSALIMVKRQRKFHVGQRLKLAAREDVRGMCVGCTPKWRSGIVWKIESDRLYVELA